MLFFLLHESSHTPLLLQGGFVLPFFLFHEGTSFNMHSYQDINLSTDDIHYFNDKLKEHISDYKTLSLERRLAIIFLCSKYGLKEVLHYYPSLKKFTRSTLSELTATLNIKKKIEDALKTTDI